MKARRPPHIYLLHTTLTAAVFDELRNVPQFPRQRPTDPTQVIMVNLRNMGHATHGARGTLPLLRVIDLTFTFGNVLLLNYIPSDAASTHLCSSVGLELNIFRLVGAFQGPVLDGKSLRFSELGSLLLVTDFRRHHPWSTKADATDLTCKESEI